MDAYQPGRLFDPADALGVMELATFFDPRLLEIVRQVSAGDAERFPTWQTLINAAILETDRD